MNITTILIIVNVFAAISMIALTLMQSSKSDMGSAFGGGGSQSMFGSRGSSNFLSKSTAIMCAVFFLSSIGLAYTYAKRNEANTVDQSVTQKVSEVPTFEVPASENPVINADELESSVPSASSLEDASSSVQESIDAIQESAEKVLEEGEAIISQ